MNTKILTTMALLAVSGCATPPAEYAGTLSARDPRWLSPECIQIRASAASDEANRAKPLNMGTALLLGPYGLGLAAASREHQQKQRRLLAREVHLRCSSLPLPEHLQVPPSEAAQADAGFQRGR